MERKSRVIFVLALGISVMVHFVLFNISSEVKYGKVGNDKEKSGIRVVDAVVVRRSVVKNLGEKKVQMERTHSKRQIANKNVTLKTIKTKVSRKSESTIEPPDVLVNRKLEKIRNYEKLIVPGVEVGRDAGGKDSKIMVSKRKIYLPFYKVDKRPEFIFKAQLRYPPKAKKLGVEGTVILEVKIDEKGHVVSIRIIKKGGFGFDKAAIEMIKKSKFSPAYSHGKPIPVRMRFSIVFQLE